jgi:ankyrin repeat protein
MPIATDPVEILQVKKLLHCVRTEDYYQIKKLCEKGVDYLINYNEPHEGLTALILAAVKNDEKMLEFLLENGAQPNIVDLNVTFILFWRKKRNNSSRKVTKTLRNYYSK